MRWARVLAVVLSLLPATAVAQTASSGGAGASSLDRFGDFVQVAVRSPTPNLLAVGGGLFDTIGRFPREWDGSSAFVKRTLARRGMGFASDAIGHTAGAVLHHRVRYDACQCRGWSRVPHAVSRAFVSVREDGGSAPNYSLWLAKAGAAGLANAWYPPSYSKGDILREAGLGIVISGGLNILSEFSPDLLRMVGLRRSP